MTKYNLQTLPSSGGTVAASIQALTNYSDQNGYLVFDYQDSSNYKYVGFDAVTDQWIFGRRRGQPGPIVVPVGYIGHANGGVPGVSNVVVGERVAGRPWGDRKIVDRRTGRVSQVRIIGIGYIRKRGPPTLEEGVVVMG
ncbi:MAG: hypothetical protein L0332_08425 [Chloroflexi bacterium]|nr:hypothetical protein [Chloroflexota bacterium]MCI0575410.1 hypothetical protein [Chloroflexota bacterium]MCI0645466.1 hypothetical protein [Chloroflexota bacterium]MCI0726733.1 hypothetical protein [Chloroflexota bacterium]